MGIVTDDTSIQFRMLNRSKGAAMWSPRSQSDRAKYIQRWRELLDSCPNLDIRQDVVTEFIIKDGTVQGVKTGLMCEFGAKCIMISAGSPSGRYRLAGSTSRANTSSEALGTPAAALA